MLDREENNSSKSKELEVWEETLFYASVLHSENAWGIGGAIIVYIIFIILPIAGGFPPLFALVLILSFIIVGLIAGSWQANDFIQTYKINQKQLINEAKFWFDESYITNQLSIKFVRRGTLEQEVNEAGKAYIFIGVLFGLYFLVTVIIYGGWLVMFMDKTVIELLDLKYILFSIYFMFGFFASTEIVHRIILMEWVRKLVRKNLKANPDALYKAFMKEHHIYRNYLKQEDKAELDPKIRSHQ